MKAYFLPLSWIPHGSCNHLTTKITVNSFNILSDLFPESCFRSQGSTFLYLTTLLGAGMLFWSTYENCT